MLAQHCIRIPGGQKRQTKDTKQPIYQAFLLSHTNVKFSQISQVHSQNPFMNPVCMGRYGQIEVW